jgi:hypothetical protein
MLLALARGLEARPLLRERHGAELSAQCHVLGKLQQLQLVLLGGWLRHQLSEHDEGCGRVHLSRLEDALHQRLTRVPELDLVLGAEILDDEEQLRLLVLLLPKLDDIRLDCVQLLQRRNVARLGVHLTWGVLMRLGDEEACVGRDDGLHRRLSLIGACT